jgi:hypothetical protein
MDEAVTLLHLSPYFMGKRWFAQKTGDGGF